MTPELEGVLPALLKWQMAENRLAWAKHSWRDAGDRLDSETEFLAEALIEASRAEQALVTALAAQKEKAA